MTDLKKVSANRAYRKGLWNVTVWPLVIVVIVLAGLVWGIIEAIVPLVISYVIMGGVILLMLIWSSRRKGTWKLWMVDHSANPKTSLELAKSSFLKYRLSELLTLWTKAEQATFVDQYDKRMENLRKEYLASASEKYGDKHTVNVHFKFSGLLWILLFEALVIAGLIFLFMGQADMTIKAILSVLLVIGFIGVVYTIKTVWNRNVTVLEISKHGIRIEKAFFGWLELEVVDIVRGNLLVYKTYHGEQQEYKMRNLSLSGEYLDELILFYRTEDKSSLEV